LKFETIEAQHLALGFVIQDQGDFGSYFRERDVAGGAKPLEVVGVAKPKEPFLDAATADKLRAELSWLGSLEEPQPPSGDMPLSEASRAILRAAFNNAKGAQVTPLHLLGAMLDDDNSRVTRCLIENGITPERVEEAIRTQRNG
jgi:hypothetical protein